MTALLAKRFAGGLLAAFALWLLSGPLLYIVWGSHQLAAGRDPKALVGVAYQTTLGVMFLLIGVYLLTRRAKPKN